MAARRKLKVFRTSIGFHDAYVAAPSRKAALDAWGSDRDLFRIGAAEEIEDGALTREPLARPGEVIKVQRGSAAEHVAALPKRKTRGAAKAKPAATRAKLPPRPSRADLDKAEAALEAAENERDAALDALARQEEELARKKRRLTADWDKKVAALEKAREIERDKLTAALDRWRQES